MNDKTLLEKPINNKDDDLFNITSYVDDLEKAIKDGAKFIAIDGEYGSGKSSLVNLLSVREKSKNNKSTFVNVNFLNINEKKKNDNNEEDIINNYHRYFVNQVANDICSNPFEIEQLFYHNFISYSVTNPSRYRLWRIIVDKLLLLLTSYMIIFLTYKTFLQDIEELQFIFKYSNKINPIVLMSMFVFVIIYGYGIHKPNKQESSPMLDIDKCRNIFYKTVSTKIKRNLILKKKEKTKLFLIIDDLDRIEEGLQVEIISLLYNEYYPLKIDGVELIFIFMLNTHKIQDRLSNNNLSNDKLFDYILPVSNNQKHIIRHLTNKMIKEHNTLNEIFNNSDIKNKEYIINQICKKYSTIRKIKHFFNKLISKYNYLKSKNIEEINYDEMIIISLLSDEVETSQLDMAIANTINNEPIVEKVKKIEPILKDCNNKKIFDVDYYIYLYNFIDKDDLLTHHENELYSIAEKGYDFMSMDEDKKILDYLENEKVRYDKIFHEVFKYLDNNTKLVFLSSKKFCNYLERTTNIFDNIDIKNAYQNYFGYCLCDNIALTKANKEDIIFDLQKSLEAYLSSKTSGNMSTLRFNFVQFLENMDYRIVQFKLNDYFSAIDIDDYMYELLFENIEYKNMEIGFYLLNKKIIKCKHIKKYIDVPFILKINSLPNEIADPIKKQILETEGIPFAVLISIISNENVKYENIDTILDKLNQSENFIEFDKLKLILNNYGYNSKLDKHILQSLTTNESKIIDFINKNKYTLSKTILNKLNSISNIYKYTNFYENMFIDNEFYNVYIYSRILKNKKFDLNENLIHNDKYKKSLLENYSNVKNWAIKYPFSKKYTDLILNNFDFNSIDFSTENFWKITNHLLNINELVNLNPILTILNSKNKLENFIDYCIKQNINIEFIKYLREYAEEHSMSKKIKSKLTRNINKVKN